MLLQSLLMYTSLIVIMLLFSLAIAEGSIYDREGDNLKKSQPFWRFEIIFPIILFAVFFGMRYDVGVDYLAYLEGYLSKTHVGRNELLFNLLSEIGWKFNIHSVVYFSIIAFIQIFFFLYAFKDERFLFPFLIFFLFTNGSWQFWMNGIRQALAMCIWIFSLKYIEEKKLIKYVVWGIVAFLFHRSAIILFLFYPILRNGRDYFKSIKLQLILLAGAFVFREFFWVVIARFEPVINVYKNLLGPELYSGSYSLERLTQSVVDVSGSGLAFLFRIALNITIVLYSTKLKKFYDSKRFIIIYFFFFLGLITSYMFPAGIVSFTRPFRYFYVFDTIMYAYFAYYLLRVRYREAYSQILLYSILILFLGIFYLSQITADQDSHLWYQFYFQQNIPGYPNGQ